MASSFLRFAHQGFLRWGLEHASGGISVVRPVNRSYGSFAPRRPRSLHIARMRRAWEKACPCVPNALHLYYIVPLRKRFGKYERSAPIAPTAYTMYHRIAPGDAGISPGGRLRNPPDRATRCLGTSCEITEKRGPEWRLSGDNRFFSVGPSAAEVYISQLIPPCRHLITASLSSWITVERSRRCTAGPVPPALQRKTCSAQPDA